MENRRTRISPERLESYIMRLRRIIRNLGYSSLALITLTLVNILVFVMLWALPRLFDVLGLIVFSIMSFVIVFALAIIFERVRKEGEALFQTISDQLHGFLSSKLVEGVRLDDLLLEAKFALQLFTQNSELPLFPSRMGPGIVVVLNLILLVLSLYSERFVRGF